MGKSVYSLVLSDDIVRAVDAMAYKMNTSRSALIDRILAERLSVQTPELRMRSIMESIGRFFDDDIFRYQTSSSDGGMIIRSALAYKYKPTIRYSVELLRDSEYLGRLKVSFRTQNAALIYAMNDFLNIYANIESGYMPDGMNIIYEIDNDKMVRTLSFPVILNGEAELTSDEIAALIADYVSFTDKMIKLYFELSDDRARAIMLIDKAYSDRMRKASAVM